MNCLFKPLTVAGLYHGDSRDVLKTLPDNSIDACVTDPPYALVSIVKRFGGKNAAPAKGNDAYARASAGFMGQSWDTGEVAFAAEFWSEVYRVLKPGGHVVSFGGTRTYHRMAVAIEDAGFEIRDQIQWLYGTGFPKSHDVSKAIDKSLGGQREMVKPRSVIGHQRDIGNRRPYMDDPNHMTVSDIPATPEAEQWEGWGTALKPANEPICLARKPLEGTVAENVLKWGTGAINIDGCRIATDEVITNHSRSSDSAKSKGKYGDSSAQKTHQTEGQKLGRFPANVITDGSDEVVSAFPTTSSGAMKRRVGAYSGDSVTGFLRGDSGPHNQYGDSGSAARFFYSAKASKADRGEGNNHPTVKPTDLMRYLCRLVTPPGGVVLDPFMGSGSTGKAAHLEGFKFVGIEREEEYFRIAQGRVNQC